jgi:hypothetical protein
MATTVGAITQTPNANVALTCPNASGGTPPYTYQWYRSTVNGFTPGPTNILTGATKQQLSDIPTQPSTLYYYVCVAKDSGMVTGNSPQFGPVWNDGTVFKPSTQQDANQTGDPAGNSKYGFGNGQVAAKGVGCL